MSDEPRVAKPDPLTPTKTIFGAFCPVCKKFAPIGADDVVPSVGVSRFRDKLRQDNYQVPEAICDDPECGHTFVATVDQIYLGEHDDTLPTRETF
jgi:hypothetical protein